MSWTDKQLEAINHREGSAIVSAAAGSGKTAVLVERVIRLLMDEENPVNADELVVATFTEKAAGELKTRLNTALSKAMEENPHNEHLKDQLLKLEDASISTISSFCIRLIRNNSVALGLSPDFGIIDEAESKLLFARALETTLDDFYENAPEEEKGLVYDWYGEENDKELCAYITNLCAFFRKLPDSEKAVKDWTHLYENPALYEDEYRNIYIDRFIKPIINKLINALPEDRFIWDEKATPFLEGWRNLIKSACIYARVYDGFIFYNENTRSYTEDDEEFDEYVEELFSTRTELIDVIEAELPAVPRKNMKEGFDNSYLKEIDKELKKLWTKLMTEFGYIMSFTKDITECAPVFKILLSLSEKTEAEFSRRKRLKNKVDFSDAEIFTLKLLKDEKIAADLRRSISVIIVDEFQDSNDMQYEIFRTLSRDGKNLFFVGDIKQSIYHFRGANPHVFARILEDPAFKTIYLNKNFRSSSAVIDSVNALFEKTMTKEVGEVDYDENAKLVQGKAYETDEAYKTELIRLCGKNMKAARISEAAYVADRIRNMVESGFLVTDKDGRRPCCYGDFAILMGKYKTNAFIYKNALAKAGVPFEAKEDGAFTDFIEVKLVLSLIRIIDNPYNDCALAVVLSNPPYSFSANELMEAKLSGGKKHKNMFSGIIGYAKENEKARLFLEEFTALRNFSAEHSPEQLVRKIYDESGVVTAILAMPDGDKRDSNLKLLINYARQFSENGKKGLCDFLNYMENIDRGSIALAQAQSAAASDNSVKIMTIHGSKGLEFPICIVSNTPDFYLQRSPGKIISDIDAGIGMQVVYNDKHLVKNTFLYNYIKKLMAVQELSEEMRLLYVAATRAKEKLIFTAPTKKLTGYDCHLKWIIGSRAVQQELIKSEIYFDYAPEKREDSEEKAAERIFIKPFTEYSYMEYSKIPAKVTATQVGVKSVDDFSAEVKGVDRFLKMPTFVKSDEPKKLTGKKKGDAYHKAMELLDFSGDVSQLDDLYNKGKLTEAERNSIDDEEIKAFLESDLCRRLNNSDKVYKEYPVFCEYCPEGFPEDEEKPFVQGIADLFFVENGKIVLVDYKTNTGVTPEMLREEYEGQLKIYSDALEKITGMPVAERVLWSFTLKTTVKV